MRHGIWLALLALGGCLGSSNQDLPDCTFAGSFAGALETRLDIATTACAGLSSEQVLGSSWSTGDTAVVVLISVEAQPEPGDTLDDLPAELRLSLADPPLTWSPDPAGEGCTARVDAVDELPWFMRRTVIYAGGSLGCAEPLVAEGTDQTLTLADEAEFYFMVF